MVETELGEWRRTHYSKELDASMAGSDVTIMGWISSIRGHGNITFLTLVDKMGTIQVVTKKGESPDDLVQSISKLKEHSSIGLIGTVKTSEKAPNGIEISPKDLRIFSSVEKIPPFDPHAKTVKNIDTRLEIRAIDLRRSTLQQVFNARSNVLRVIRQYFYDHNFTEINTPKMIATATEGGAALFPIFYYNKEAFLAQSPQLYKEQLTMIGAIKTGKYSRKNWIEKERNFDVFDIKNDALRTLNEVGIDNSKIAISNKSKKWYHPGRSGLLSLGSTNGPELAYFGEIHPSIIKRLDLRTENVLGFEIFLDNIPESKKKIREIKPQFLVSDYQKVVRDFAFVIDEKYSSGEIISLVKKIDKELIKTVKIFDVYQGDNIGDGKKSIAFNVMLEPKDKTLSDKDIDEISKKIISTVQESPGATLRS